MKGFSRLAVILASIILGLSHSPVFAQQVYQPEGINMPGTWNGWTNTNDATAMGAFRLKYRAIGGGQYTTLLNVRASGGNVVGGNYTMLFTSGPSTNLYANKWANGVLRADTISALSFGGSTDNTISLENGFFYTFIFADKGYANSTVSVLRTSDIPSRIDSIYGVPNSSVTAGQSVPISIELLGAKSAEEKIYLVYSTNGFSTSEAVEVTGFEGNQLGTATIPGQANGVTLQFYAVSTTIEKTKWNGNLALFTLSLNNNDGANYSVSFGSLATLLTPTNNATKVALNPTFTWSSIEGESSYRLQVSTDSDSNFESSLLDTVVTSTFFAAQKGIFAANSTYRWRVKAAKDEANWTTSFRFKTRPGIDFANLETGSGVINAGDSLRIEGKVYIPETTELSGETPQLSAWVAVSTTNTSPATWDESLWKPASFSRQFGNDDVFSAFIGQGLSNGSYFYAFRYQYVDDAFVYGGYNTSGGGFWNITTSSNGLLTVTQVPVLLAPETNRVNVPLKPILSWKKIEGARYDIQLTTLNDAGFTNPVISQNNIADTTFLPASDLAASTSYIWRLRVSGVNPGPFSEPKTFKTRGSIGFQNLQFVDNDTLTIGGTLNAYAQLFINGYTTLGTAAPDVLAWIGVSSENTNPNSWPDSAWTLAVLNEGNLTANNDEFSIQFGANLTASTYYIASRFKYLQDDFLYGGYSSTGGGSWSESNSNFVLHVVQPTSNEWVSPEKPQGLVLHQNYPNPFNPSTTITFEMEKQEHVVLSVFDVLGRKVATLIDKPMTKGSHQVFFNAQNLSSGTYLIRLETAQKTLVKTAVLIK